MYLRLDLFYGKVNRFCIRNVYHYGASKKLKAFVQDVNKENMTILALVSAKPLESNVTWC